jgi:hypothetical protein
VNTDGFHAAFSFKLLRGVTGHAIRHTCDVLRTAYYGYWQI